MAEPSSEPDPPSETAEPPSGRVPKGLRPSSTEVDAFPAGEVVESPARYRVAGRRDTRVIFCANSPNIELHVVPGLSVDPKGRKRYGPQTIFLDGAYTGAPFQDNEARQYSLDHHTGCVRSFTLATCEQAVVMLLAGLPLASGTWTLYVNEPDLDAMLAVWVLMNHVELLQDERALLQRVMPVVRLEGVIDAHGTDKEILAALPDGAYDAAKEKVDLLVASELQLKRERAWMKTNWVDHASGRLEEMDRELLPDGALADLLEIQEEGRALLAHDRIGVLLESGLGIYEVEERLKERYGAALGVIVLRTDEERYTLRLVDAFLPRDLEAAYKALNNADSRARTKGKNPNTWGGSGDIGGSPRDSGTGLSGEEILGVIAEVLGPSVPWWKRIAAWFGRLFGRGHSTRALPRSRD